MKINLKNRLLMVGISTITASFLFIGCGGGSGSGSDSSVASSLTGGTVSGSYYEKATVCFDTTGDGSCADESATTQTDSKGDFKLAKKDADVIAEIKSGVTRKHDVIGDAGVLIDNTTKTVFAIPKAFLDKAKEQGGKLVVSAISTKLYAYVKANPNKTVDEAMTAVAASLGLSSKDDLLKDFNDADLDPVIKAKLDKAVETVLDDTKGKDTLKAVTEDSGISDTDDVVPMSIPSKIDVVGTN